MGKIVNWFAKRYAKKKYKKSLGEFEDSQRKKILNKIKKRLFLTITVLAILVIALFAGIVYIKQSFNNFMTAGVAQVAVNLLDDLSLGDDDRKGNLPIDSAMCTCEGCMEIDTSGIIYTTGQLSGNGFDIEVFRLAEALAKDTDSYVWLPYTLSAVEGSGAITKRDAVYTNYSSIYANYTDRLNKKDKWGSIGLFQITSDNAMAGTFSYALTNNAERFNRAVQSAGGDLSKYTTIADKYATTIYEDRLYLPSQLGTIFYHFESKKKEYTSLANEYIPNYKGLSEPEKDVILVLIYLAIWNNGPSGTRSAFENSEDGKLGHYMVDLAKLYVDDNHFRQLINLEGVSYLGGNQYTKVVENVIKYMGKNVSDYINSKEVTGKNDWTSRVYCYTTNGLLGGSLIFKKAIESNGGNITGSLAKLKGKVSNISGAVGFEDIKLLYTDKSLDGVLQKEYPTVYSAMDYSVNLLTIGNDYNSGGAGDLPDRKLDNIDGIIIHYTGTEVNGTAEARRAWYDLPYNYEDGSGSYTSSHFIIGADGKILQIAPLDNEVIIENSINRSKIVIDVNYTNVNGAFGSKAYNSLLHLVAWLCTEFNIDTDTNFIAADKSISDALYRDMGAIQRHYDVIAGGGSQNASACPLYWVPNDGSAIGSGTTDGGNARWISFKKDVTSFILTYKDSENFAPNVEVPGLAEAKELAKYNEIPNWKTGEAVVKRNVTGCSCGSPCTKCNCHNGLGRHEDNTGLTGRAKVTDFGYGSFNGPTWASSQFLNNAKTVIKAMIDSGYGYEQSLKYDPFGDFYPIRYDCSGYVSAVLHYSGYTTFKNQTSRNFDANWDSYFTDWKRIYNFDELEPGDIMVMEAGGSSRVKGQIGHVEIYAGDKRVYSVGSDDYLVNHPNGDPEDATHKWDDKRDRFIFAWRISRPKE